MYVREDCYFWFFIEVFHFFSRYLVVEFLSVLYKKWKTSAVSTTDWMVETQLCKLRGTSDTFVGRAYSVFHTEYGVCELTLRYGCWYPVSQILRKVVRACSFGFKNMRRNSFRSDFVRYQAKTWKQPCVTFRGQGDAAVKQIASMDDSYGYTIVICVWPQLQ